MVRLAFASNSEMAMENSSPSVATSAAVLPFEASDAVATAFESVAAKGRDVLTTSFDTWTQESRSFLEGMARDGAEALKALQACKSPLEVLAVEQNWLVARSSAYFEVSRRMLQAAAAVAAEPEPPMDVPLPE